MIGTSLYLTIILAPLFASVITGLFGFILGKRVTHTVAIMGVLISTICSYVLLYKVQIDGLYYNGSIYTWLTMLEQTYSVGILIDSLTAVMLVVVTSVSLMGTYLYYWLYGT